MILGSEVKILNRVKVFDKSEVLEDHFSGKKSTTKGFVCTESTARVTLYE